MTLPRSVRTTLRPSSAIYSAGHGAVDLRFLRLAETKVLTCGTHGYLKAGPAQLCNASDMPALVAFAESRADQVVSELDDADQVRYELSGLATISKILATDMSFMTTKLLAHIEELEDKRESAVPSDPEKERHEAPPPEYFDVDELFRGLLER